MPSRLPIGPILRIASICSRKSSSVSSPLPIFAAASSAFSASKICSACSIRREHVAHAQDAAGHPVGVEDVEVLELLAAGREQDRHAGDLAHRQRGTAAGVAVELGQHHAGEADALTERLGGGDGVLADHRVEHEDHFVGIHGVADRAGLAHQLLVDAEAACGVDDDDVVVLGLGLGQARGRDGDRVTRAPCRPNLRPCRDAGRRRRHRRVRRRSEAG